MLMSKNVKNDVSKDSPIGSMLHSPVRDTVSNALVRSTKMM